MVRPMRLDMRLLDAKLLREAKGFRALRDQHQSARE
jgi:hypothetical protein